MKKNLSRRQVLRHLALFKPGKPDKPSLYRCAYDDPEFKKIRYEYVSRPCEGEDIDTVDYLNRVFYG